MKFVQALLCCSLAASAALSTRRSLLLKAPVAVATAALAPAAAFASGVSLEEAAKNAEKYRVKSGVCTPTNPAECSKQYEKMLDPRKGLSEAELKIRDERNEKEMSSLKSMMATYDYKPSK
mmetsp:Transcript_7777/g.24482  ORF Transcript_7777/g.24482 Transcript_7777/m.24482 type:complete len:121 (+) Transcript_7777:130-492(+)